MSPRARPAGLPNIASTPWVEARFENASPTLLAPTMMRPAEFPPVPRRSSEPAHAGLASSASAANAASTFLSRSFIVSTPCSCRVCWVRGGRRPSEVVEAFLLHEDRQLHRGRSHARRIDVGDVDAAADRQPMAGVQVPDGFGRVVVLLDRAHQVP